MGAADLEMALLRAEALCVIWAVLLPGAYGAAGSLIPDPNDWYTQVGLPYFKPTFLRYSQTVQLFSPNDKLYWAVNQDQVSEHLSVRGQKHTNRATLFEMIDAGTLSNVPRNTRPRPADPYDAGNQHFFLRYNESFILRSIELNKFVATVGTFWQSRVTLVDDVSVAETFRVLPTLNYRDPNLKSKQLATNVNLPDNTTNVRNGTEIHLLNTQLNYVNMIRGVKEVLTQGPGTKRVSMWGSGDVFQLIHQKQLEG